MTKVEIGKLTMLAVKKEHPVSTDWKLFLHEL